MFGRAHSLDNPTVLPGCWCSCILAVFILFEIAQQDWHLRGYERAAAGGLVGDKWGAIEETYGKHIFIVYVK